MPARSIKGINLLPKDNFQFSTLGRLFRWTTTIGRVLVVMTEFVVILAFASRFYFDKTLNDKTEELESKLAVIENYTEIEIQAREILAKQKGLEDFAANKIDISSKFKLLSETMIGDIVLDDATFTNKVTSIRGKAGSESSFARATSLLKTNPNITKIDLDQAIFDQSVGSLRFAIKIHHK